MRDHELSLAGWILIQSAKTLRERLFARTIWDMTHNSVKFRPLDCQEFALHPVSPDVQGFMYATSVNTWSREAMNILPILRPAKTELSDPELEPWLQDLADILAVEATEAFTESYYPGVPDLDPPVEDGHVELVMQALQREMDREGRSRQKVPVKFTDLLPERQRALAERRRFWYKKFGIGLEEWKKGTFSLWAVADEPPPEWLAARNW